MCVTGVQRLMSNLEVLESVLKILSTFINTLYQAKRIVVEVKTLGTSKKSRAMPLCHSHRAASLSRSTLLAKMTASELTFVQVSYSAISREVRPECIRASKAMSPRMKPAFGQHIGRRSRRRSKASLSEKRHSRTRNAIVIVLDRDTPAAQWTRHRPRPSLLARASFMKQHAVSKCGDTSTSSSSSNSRFRYVICCGKGLPSGSRVDTTCVIPSASRCGHFSAPCARVQKR